MSELTTYRRFRRSEVRGISFIELLLVIVLTLLLILTFSYSDLTAARASLGAQKKQTAEVEKELAVLRPLADPQTLSRLRNIDDLTRAQKRLDAQLAALRKEARGYQKFVALKQDLARRGRKLEADLQLLAQAEAKNMDTKKLADRVVALSREMEGMRARLTQRIKELEGQNRNLNANIARLKVASKTRDDDPDKRGLGLPPCWEDKGGAVPTFNITMTDRAFQIAAAWSARFENQARQSKAIQAMVGHRLPIANFRRLAQALKKDGRAQPNGGCVYYATLIDRTESKNSYKTQRLIAEQYFYPYRIR